MNGAVLARLPAAPIRPVVVPGSVHSCDPIPAATGFLAAGTSLKGSLKVFPMFSPQPAENWRSTTTGSPEVVGGWPPRKDLAIAVRLGGRGRLVILQADDAAALDDLTDRFGPLPPATVRSVSPSGKLLFWMKVSRDDVPTRLDLAPGVKLFATGSWMKLPPHGLWVAPFAPSNAGADYEPLPHGLMAEIMCEVDPAPTVRRF